MKNLLLVPFFAITFLTVAQTPLPYYTGFDNTQEQAGWTEYRKGDASLYQWNYNSFTHFTAPNSLSHSYPVGGSQVTEDWFVSPEFDFSNGGRIDSIRYLFSGFGVPQNGDTVAIYILNGSPDPDLATSVTLLKDYRGNDYNNDNTWRVDTSIVIPAVSGKSYLAFRYHTVVNWLDVRFDNLQISGLSTGIKDKDLSKNFKIYPNPAKDNLTIEVPSEKEYKVELFDLSGRLIDSKNIVSGNSSFALGHIEKGMIMVRILDGDEVYMRKITIQ